MGKNRFTRLLLVCASMFMLQNANAQGPGLQQKIDAFLRGKFAKSNITGMAVAVVHADSTIFLGGYGTTSSGQRVTANTSFGIASLSKGFTATAVLQLAAAGKIDLDAPVNTYIKQFKTADARGAKITVRQLLHQISGLSDKGYAEFALDEQPKTADGAVANMQNANLTAAPGTKFQYHNPNYQILAKLVEVVSHQPFNVYLKQHIFDPAGMRHTADLNSTGKFAAAGLNKGHIYLADRPITFAEPEWFVDGAAGVISTANDMAKWLTVQMGSQPNVLDSGSLSIMQNPPRGTAFNYGMGWVVNKDNHTLYHSGILWTYSSQQLIMQDKQYGIVALFNDGFSSTTDYYSVVQGIKDIINGKQPEQSNFPVWLYTVLVAGVFLLIWVMAIRRFMRVSFWYQNCSKRKGHVAWGRMILRLIPLLLFVSIPILLTMISGRVLSWVRITLMFGDLVLILGSLAFINLAIVLHRLFCYVQREND